MTTCALTNDKTPFEMLYERKPDWGKFERVGKYGMGSYNGWDQAGWAIKGRKMDRFQWEK